MANIRELLENVKYAIFGKDVRQSIHDAIEECYNTASIDHDNANMEVKLARGTHKTLNDRIYSNENLISENAKDISRKMNIGDKIKASQIDKSQGKFDETYMTEEFIQQMAGNTPVHSIPADNSITHSKLADESIKFRNLNSELFITGNTVNVKSVAKDYKRLRLMVQFYTKRERINTVTVKFGIVVKSGSIAGNTTFIACQLYGNKSDNLSSGNMGAIDITSSRNFPVSQYNTPYIMEHSFTIDSDNENIEPEFTVISLDLKGATPGENYEVEYNIISVLINDKVFDINKYEPYSYDHLDPVVTGGLSSNAIVRSSDLVELIDSTKQVVMEKDFTNRVDNLIEYALSDKLPGINYTGSTKDSTGLFMVYMFDIRQLLDTDIEYIANNPLVVEFLSSNRTNTSGIGCQLFNNNNSQLNVITGGQLFAPDNSIIVPEDQNFEFKREFSGLDTSYRYYRVCINFKAIIKEQLQTGSIGNISVKIGDIDLSPFLVDIDGLSHNSGGQTIERVITKSYATVKYVDDKLLEVNERIDNLSPGGGGTSGVASKWKNKKWCAVGDSITEKNFRANKNYHDYIKEEITCIVYNRGISGSGYQASNSIMGRVNTFESDSDLITVFAGTNDYNHGTVPLGAVGDKTEDTLCGCIHLTFERLLNRFPTKTIAVFTPLSRSNCNGLNEVENNRGYTLGQLSECIKEISHKFGIPVLDLYKESNLHPWISANNTMYFAYQNDGVSAGDGLHPNDKGQKLIGDKIKNFINSL